MYTYKSDFLSVESVDRTLQILLNFLCSTGSSFYLSTYIYTIGRTNKRVPTGLLVNILLCNSLIYVTGLLANILQSNLRDRAVNVVGL